MLDIAAILQAATIAVLVWFGNRIVTVSEKVAVHDEKLQSHDKRLTKVEDRHTAP